MQQHLFMEENRCKIYIAEEQNVITSPQLNGICWQWLFMVHLCIDIKEKAYIFKHNAPIPFAN